MASAYPPPPTFVPPIGEDKTTGKPYFEPAWLQWFLDLAAILTAAGGGGGGGGTIQHNSLTGLQGGIANEYYHLTQAEHAAILTDEDWPVGSFYFSDNATNPGALLGGTWILAGSGFLTLT